MDFIAGDHTVDVAASPVEGAANAALIDLVAETLDVPRRAVTIVSDLFTSRPPSTTSPSPRRFVADALARNLPVTLVNDPAAPHAFEINDDSARSRFLIRHMLDFMRFHLLAS